jgi:protein gp37
MGIGWVIVGGESGPGARECSLAWVESIVDQCRHADVACFVKQLGSRPTNLYTVAQPSGAFLDHWPPRDKKGGDMQEWPESLRVREFPERSPTNG